MRLSVLSSGSSANGYVLHNEEEAVVIECGCPLLDCEKALDFNLGKVKACLISHEHGDHARYARDYGRLMPLYATAGTLQNCFVPDTANIVHKMEYFQPNQVGGFKVLAFPTQHDAEQPCGFLIRHKEFGDLVFATDTYFIKYTFPGVSWFMLECNYDMKILTKNLKAGLVERSVANRTLKSHMSLENCIQSLLMDDLTKVNGIVLLHLSSQNSNKELFQKKVAQATGKMVTVATKGLEIELI